MSATPSATHASLPKPPRGARLLAITGAKGGVGRTTIAVNLALALAREGIKVALVDADIYGFAVPDLLGLDAEPELDGKVLVPPSMKGIEVASMRFFVEGNDPVLWRGELLGSAIEQFVTDVRWTEPEVMLLDMPPGTGDAILHVISAFPNARHLLVTTPDHRSARISRRAGIMALQAGRRLVGIVENMCRAPGGAPDPAPFGEGGGAVSAEALGVPLLGQVPFHPGFAAQAQGIFPTDSPAGRAISDLAEHFIRR